MRRIDGKFHIDGERIISITGAEVPEDEPTFLLRGRDIHALYTLRQYLARCRNGKCTVVHLEGIQAAIEAFEEFKSEHADRMKQPGITRGAREIQERGKE